MTEIEQIWSDHFDTLNETGKVAFLLNLKRLAYEQQNDLAKKSLRELAEKWVSTIPLSE